MIKKLLLSLSFLSLGFVALVQPTFAFSQVGNYEDDINLSSSVTFGWESINGDVPIVPGFKEFDNGWYGFRAYDEFTLDAVNYIQLPLNSRFDGFALALALTLSEPISDFELLTYGFLTSSERTFIEIVDHVPDMPTTVFRRDPIITLFNDTFGENYAPNLWFFVFDTDDTSSYLAGYNDGIVSVDTSHYYDLGQNDGYNSGYSQGLADGTSGQFSVSGFFNSLFGADGLGGLFNIQFGDVTLGQILLIPLILALIPFILGLFKGRGKD